MIKERYILYLLFSLFISYLAQGALYETGSSISKLSLVLILGISGIYFLKTVLNRNNQLFYKLWTALLVLNCLGFILTGSFSDQLHFEMFKSILICSLPFYPAYYFSQKGILSSKHLLVFFLLIIPVSILKFYFNRELAILEKATGSEDVVNNSAYMFVSLIPFVFCFKKNRLLAILSMLLIMFFIIQGAKRGAIVVGAAGLLIYLYYFLQTINKKNRVTGYVLSIIGIAVILYYGYTFYLNNEYLIERMEELSEGSSGTSNRDIIYTNLFNAWLNSDSIFKYLFGFGFASSLKLSGTGNFAHNDWLELLTNFGVLGVSIYSGLFYASYKSITNKYFDKEKRIMLFAVVFMWLLVSFFSMGYTNSNGYLRSLMLAFLFGRKEKQLV